MEILICFNLGPPSHVFCPSDQWEQQPLKLVQHWELQWCNRLHVVPTGNCPLGSVWYWLLKATENFFSLPLTRRRYCDQDLLKSCSEISWNLFHIVTENLFDHTKALFPPSSTVQFSSVRCFSVSDVKSCGWYQWTRSVPSPFWSPLCWGT